MLKCSFCGNRIVYTWTGGSLPICDKCGAQLQIDVTDKAENVGIENTPERVGSSKRKSKIFLVVMICITMIMIAGVIKWKGSLSSEKDVRNSSSIVKNSIYVEEIGRTCYKDGEDWYDSDTQCWFWYNDEQSPYQWQYWYEGISSDYGDYGWMEYDMDEKDWYVEVSDGNWIHLPDTYDTSKLWHMTDEYANAYE